MNAISPDAESVRRALVAKGIETPMIDPTQCKDERRAAIASHMPIRAVRPLKCICVK